MDQHPVSYTKTYARTIAEEKTSPAPLALPSSKRCDPACCARESASSKHKPEALDIGRKSMQGRNTYSSICYTQELMNKGKRTQDLKKKKLSQDQETCRNHRSCGQRCREVIMPSTRSRTGPLAPSLAAALPGSKTTSPWLHYVSCRNVGVHTMFLFLRSCKRALERKMAQWLRLGSSGEEDRWETKRWVDSENEEQRSKVSCQRELPVRYCACINKVRFLIVQLCSS